MLALTFSSSRNFCARNSRKLRIFDDIMFLQENDGFLNGGANILHGFVVGWYSGCAARRVSVVHSPGNLDGGFAIKVRSSVVHGGRRHF